MRALVSLVLVGSMACCPARNRPAPVASTGAAVAAPLAEKRLSLFELHSLSVQHCASCHQSSVSREKPAALAVFDLDQSDWSTGLSRGQLAVFFQRMQGELDASTRARLHVFVTREAATR